MNTVIVQLALSFLAFASGYNLDVQNVTIVQDPQPSNERKSYFGYSVALYSLDTDSLVLVGAPRANSSRDIKRKIIEPGVVYLCTTKSERNCTEWSVDHVDYYYSRDQPYVNKNYAWLGATVQVEKYRTPVAAVCSPRWSYMLPSYRIFGLCYSKIIEGPTSFNTHNRVNTRRHYFFPVKNFSIYWMTGFSLHIKPDNHDLIVGYSNGFHVFDHKETCKINSTYQDNVANMNFGYSVTTGYFNGKNRRIEYAAGVPRDKTMKGAVRLFSPLNFEREPKKSSQVGEYFGSSLAACDLNSDGRDDLLVGAPLWSENGDEGRIAIYLSKNEVKYYWDLKWRYMDVVRSLFKEQSIRGTVPGARFGSTIVCLGDLDLDGYADVAVGAPYEDGHGAVYIFNGGPEGLTSYSQRIRGSELQGGVRGFGVSISGPRDVDGNGYVDVAVGAYLSGQAVLFRSRPVVVLKLTRLAPSANFSLRQNSTQLMLDVCAFYNGSFVSNTLKVNFILVFDNRVYVNENYIEKEKSIAINNETCISVKAALEPSDLLKPIKVDANISISGDCPNCPVINHKLSRLRHHKEMAFILECGNKSICVSDLIVEIISDLGPNDSFVMGSKSNVSVEIRVLNSREPAYYSYLYIDIPDPILVSKMSTECYEQSKWQGSLRIQCKIGNPLRNGNQAIIPIALDMSAIQYNDKTKTIDVKAETQSEEFYMPNNMASLKILFFVNASLAINGCTYAVGQIDPQKSFGSNLELDTRCIRNLCNGKASEKLHTYSGVEETSSVESIAFEHIYEIQKFAVSPIEEVTFLLRVPTHCGGVQVSTINEIESQVDDVQYKNANESEIPLSDSTFSFKEENMTLLSHENRTYYLNCTNEEVDCRTFLWTLGPFRKPQSSAKVTVKFELLLSKHLAAVIKGKDILFISEATVKITKPNKTMETSERRPNYKQISTFFIHRPTPETVAVWIIVLSILLGVVLVILATVMLYKLGFFKRKRIEDRRNLTSQEISEELFN